MSKENLDESVDLSKDQESHPADTPNAMKDRSSAEQIGQEEMRKIVVAEEVCDEQKEDAEEA